MSDEVYRNNTKKCLGCGIYVLNESFLCCRCDGKYPGIVEQAIKDAKRELRVEELRLKREVKIFKRRSSFHCV